jgi:pyrroline-5-carboxylate reductase
MGSGHLVVSLVAGVPIRAIESHVGAGTRVVRAMPNTAALARASATAVASGTSATDADLDVARALFDAVGKTVVLDENHLDAVTGLSGSGPAYVMLFIEALADGGVKVGLPRDVALLLAAQTVQGAAKLLIDSGEHPARLKDMVTSPGGTTIAGVSVLEAAGVRGSIMAAVEAATLRAAELGKRA